jgi:hypothetical protein
MSRLAKPTGKKFSFLTSWTHYTKSESKCQVFYTQIYNFNSFDTQADALDANKRVKCVFFGLWAHRQSLTIGSVTPNSRQTPVFRALCRESFRGARPCEMVLYFSVDGGRAAERRADGE